MNKTAKTQLLSLLKTLYPEPKSELNFSNSYQLIISVMLSAQCTDKKVNEITPSLFNKYPDFNSLSAARLDRLESLVRPINYYKTKAKHLIQMGKQIMSEFNGEVPRTMSELTSLPGVGRKTANVVLNELGIQATIPVDTHVFRVSRRLSLAHSNKINKVEEELMKEFPKSQWRFLHHALILHGRRICKAQKPLCDICELRDICPSSSSEKINLAKL